MNILGIMEQNGSNQNLSPTMLCRSGCGFYGSPSCDGMCSKCYKDMVKRRQQNSSPTGLLSPSAVSSAVSESVTNLRAMNISQPSPERPKSTTTPSVETASPTVPSTSQSSQESKEKDEEAAQSEAATAKTSSSEEAIPESQSKKPKKNKCHTCKKKVGLTGFQCRCGGLFCSLHRYSDKHDCQFDYKELAQEEIRKHNPVIVGVKVQKI